MRWQGDMQVAQSQGVELVQGVGQAPARQAGMGAGLPVSTEATTINKMCGSGMQAAMMAHDALAAGSADVIVAGGMESMTNAPYLMQKHRGGARIGHDVISDSMYLDGLEDAYTPGKLMGAFAEDSARTYQFTREAQDEYALESLSRALEAIASGAFRAEITPVEVTGRKGTVTVTEDEQPGKAMPEKIPTLKPAFAKDGTITAATSSSISDGAAALVLTRDSVAKAKGLDPATGKPLPGSQAFIRTDEYQICHSGQPCPRAGYWRVHWLADRTIVKTETIRQFKEGEIFPTWEVKRFLARPWPLKDKTTLTNEPVEWSFYGDAWDPYEKFSGEDQTMPMAAPPEQEKSGRGAARLYML